MNIQLILPTQQKHLVDRVKEACSTGPGKRLPFTEWPRLPLCLQKVLQRSQRISSRLVQLLLPEYFQESNADN